MNVISPETRMMGLPYGEEITIVGQTMWTGHSGLDTVHECDRWTDPKERATMKFNKHFRTVQVYAVTITINITFGVQDIHVSLTRKL